MKIYLYILLLSLYVLNGCAQQNDSSTYNKINISMKMSDDEWKKKLSPEQYYILREKGTERPFTGKWLMNHEKGVYTCAGCGTELFTHDMKFDSHCGWPSFDREIAGGKIIQTVDSSHGMNRIEIICAQCGGHLGHIFDEGPTETGKRYCVNSLSLDFVALENNNTKTDLILDTITLGGGCFWCIEAVFEDLKGVEKVISGYSGGKSINPTYQEVCNENTGHAEVVQIIYNKALISMEEILEVFFSVHDPTTLNRQGADEGIQYRSVIFYHKEYQKNSIDTVINTLNSAHVFNKPIVTEVTPFVHFYKAEEYHQVYYKRNREQPYCRAVIKPKLDKFHQLFSEKIKRK